MILGDLPVPFAHAGQDGFPVSLPARINLVLRDVAFINLRVERRKLCKLLRREERLSHVIISL